MPSGAQAIMEKVEATQKNMLTAYDEGDFGFADELLVEIFLQLNSYITAGTFEGMRTKFDEEFAAAMPKKGSSPLPEAITALQGQIDTQLPGIDAQAESQNYAEATKDLNALFTSDLAELQKAVGSYDQYYEDYNKNLKDLENDYLVHLADNLLHPDSLDYLKGPMDDAYKAMKDAEKVGDYKTAFEQKEKLVTAVAAFEKGLESHNAEIKKQYDTRSKDLGDRWNKLLDASPQNASESADSTDPTDATQKLKDLETEIVNGFADATENAKQAPYDPALAALDKVETSLDAYDAELAGLEQGAAAKQEEADYRALKKELAPKVTEAVDLPYESLADKNQPIHDHFSKAEEHEAAGLFIDGYDELEKVKSALEVYEKALAALDDEMMEFVEKEDEWKKKVAKNWSVIEDYPDLSGKWEEVQADVLASASKGDFAEADSKMEGYLTDLKFAVFGDLDAAAIAARKIKEGKEPGFRNQRLEIERMRTAMQNEAVSGDYEMALSLMWDLNTAIDDFEQMLVHHANNVKTRKKATNGWIRMNSEDRATNIAADIGLAKSKFVTWVEGRDDFTYAGDWGFTVIQSLIGLVAGAFGTPVLGFAAVLAVGALGKAVGLKDNLELDYEANAARIGAAADTIAQKWLEFDVGGFGPYLMTNHAVLWDKISDALKESNNLDALDYLAESGIPRDDPKYMAKILKRMQDDYLSQVIEQIDHFEVQEEPK